MMKRELWVNYLVFLENTFISMSVFPFSLIFRYLFQILKIIYENKSYGIVNDKCSPPSHKSVIVS